MKKLILTFVALLTVTSSAFAQIGSLSSDLVFTPITPCRIVDTRGAGGTIAANTKRDFIAWVGVGGTYTAQGGKAGSCNLPTDSVVAAIAVNLVVVAPAAEGWIAAWPQNESQPLVSNLNYKAGDVLANSAILKISQSGVLDFSVYTTSTTHFVADVTGYYSKPVATALQCVETANTDLVIAANDTNNVTAPACASGYTQTATNCTTNSWLMPLVYAKSGTCSARNGDVGNRTLSASRTCCRIPGR